MFSEKNNHIFYYFYQTYCVGSKELEQGYKGNEEKSIKKYNGAWRSGDEKVRNLYENILLQFMDKFGQTEDFENFYKAFYKAVYQIRCNNKSIRLETILKSGAKDIIKEINDVVTPDILKKHQFNPYQIRENNLANGVIFIKEAINNNFIENGTEST